MYLLVLLNSQFSVQLLRESVSLYFVSLTSLSKEEDKKLNASLNSSSLSLNVTNFSLFCAITLISSLSVSNLSKLDIIRCASWLLRL